MDPEYPIKDKFRQHENFLKKPQEATANWWARFVRSEARAWLPPYEVVRLLSRLDTRESEKADVLYGDSRTMGRRGHCRAFLIATCNVW